MPGKNGLLVRRHVIVVYKTEVDNVIHLSQIMVVATVMVMYIRYKHVKTETVQVCILSSVFYSWFHDSF